MIISLVGGKVKVQDAKPSDTASLAQMGGKRIPNNPTTWILPGLRASYYQLVRRFGSRVILSDDQDTQDWINPKNHLTAIEAPFPLYDFQKEAIEFLVKSRHRGSMLCLSPGLGKTAVSILAAHVLECKNILIIAPLTLLGTWKREIKKWVGDDAIIIHGGMDLPDEFSGFMITNYDTAWRYPEYFFAHWDVIIFDETVVVKNRKAKKINPLKKIAQQSRRVWALSGSPTTKFLDDLFSQFQILNPSLFTSYWRFAEEYCIIDRGTWGWKIVGTKPGIDMRQEFSDIMFIRSQEEVLPELPDIIYHSIDLELNSDQAEVYNDIRDKFIRQLKSGPISIPNKIAQITHLQQVVSNLYTLDRMYASSSCKTDAIIDLLKTTEVEFPIIIWTHWIPTAEKLHEALFFYGKVNRISAVTPESKRSEIIQDFQDGKINILILSMGTGKYGLTLTKARTIIYHDRWFDSDALFQSSFRVKRIGLDHRPVCITLRCPNTIETFVEDNLMVKLQNIANLTNTDLIKALGGVQ